MFSRWVCETLNNHSDVLRVACNQCLSLNKDQTKEILDFAIKGGVSLELINTSSLSIAADIQEFSLKEEAKRIVEERSKVKK